MSMSGPFRSWGAVGADSIQLSQLWGLLYGWVFILHWCPCLPSLQLCVSQDHRDLSFLLLLDIFHQESLPSWLASSPSICHPHPSSHLMGFTAWLDCRIIPASPSYPPMGSFCSIQATHYPFDAGKSQFHDFTGYSIFGCSSHILQAVSTRD